MGQIRDYKDLAVWQRSMILARLVYDLGRKLPDQERFGLRSQIQRAAVSVPANIAEGYGRQATGEYRHHLAIARGSLLELETLLLLCREIGLLQESEVAPAIGEVAHLNRMLSALIAKLR
jgi:four helix bundle protein